jgi:Uncharacterized protein conserved in bacteria
MSFKRNVVLGSLIAGCMLSIIGTGHAAPPPADYPRKPITFYIGYAPGGSADNVGRLLLPQLEARIGQTIILDNRSGGGGAIGLGTVARSAPDGYSMGFGTGGALTANVHLVPNLPYNPLTSFEYVGMTVLFPIVLVARSDSNFTTIQDVLDTAKTKTLSFGSAGIASSTHLAGELLNQMAGIKLSHVPYKGTGPAALDVIGGHLDLAFVDLPTAVPHVQSGKLRLLATTSPERSRLIPDIPTIAESGVPGYQFTTWFGIVVPKDTPKEIVDYLNTELVALLKQDQVAEQLRRAGAEPFISTPEEMRSIVEREMKRVGKVITAAGISLQ